MWPELVIHPNDGKKFSTKQLTKIPERRSRGFLRQKVRRYQIIIENTIETTTVSHNKMKMLHVQCPPQMGNFSLLNLLVLR